MWYAVSGWVLLIRWILPIHIRNLMSNHKQTRRSNRSSKINRNFIHCTSNVNSYLKLKLMCCEASESTILNLVRHRLINNAVAWGVCTCSSVEWYIMLLLLYLSWKWRQEIPPNLITTGLVNSIITQVQISFSFVFSSV